MYKGIVKEVDGEFVSNELRLTSIHKGENPLCFISYNKDGYTKYCKDYKEYWDWVENRNKSRYNDIAEHGKGYDGKNCAHCIRLLEMSIEIAKGEGINVRRPNRDELLAIRRGEIEYIDIINKSEKLIEISNKLYDNSDLPENINKEFLHNLVVKLRRLFSSHYFEETNYEQTLNV
jgi:hypothetical protein